MCNMVKGMLKHNTVTEVTLMKVTILSGTTQICKLIYH